MDSRISQKIESRGDKIARVSNSLHRVYKFTFILSGVEVHYNKGRFSLHIHL